MVHQVASCFDCPRRSAFDDYYGNTRYDCGHPWVDNVPRLQFPSDLRNVASDYSNGRKTIPNSCPLKLESLEIKLAVEPSNN